MTVEVTWKSRGPWFKSGKPDFCFFLFNLYINDLINELDKNSFEVLAYADDLCVLCDGRNQLNNVIKIIDKWSKLNGINVNKNKSGIMILKNDIKEKDNIDGYPIIREYKYLGILINFKKKSDFPDLNQGPLDFHVTSTVKCSSN